MLYLYHLLLLRLCLFKVGPILKAPLVGLPVGALWHAMVPVSVKRNPPKKMYYYEDRLFEHQIRCWIAVSAEGLQGKGSPKRSVFVQRHRYDQFVEVFEPKPGSSDPDHHLIHQLPAAGASW